MRWIRDIGPAVFGLLTGAAIGRATTGHDAQAWAFEVVTVVVLFVTVFAWLEKSTEWSERWGSWPHCNGQAGCWMHVDEEKRHCACSCVWCRVARKIRRDG